MQCITVDRVTLSFAAREIFADLSWGIDSRARSGLIGPNGAGKSSLLRIIKGDLQPDSGAVQRLRGTRVGYLPQQVDLPTGRTLLQVALELPPELAAVEQRLAGLEARLAEPSVYGNERRLTQTLAQQELVLADYERLGGAQHQGRVRSLLAHLGLDEANYDRPCESLSGGQKKLLALTRLAVARPELLLLDEPDNHLDLGARRRLEEFIRNYEGAVIIVSHDRWLLDEVVTEIVELEAGALKVWQLQLVRHRARTGPPAAAATLHGAAEAHPPDRGGHQTLRALGPHYGRPAPQAQGAAPAPYAGAHGGEGRDDRQGRRATSVAGGVQRLARQHEGPGDQRPGDGL